jgi:hypothetical protein
LELEGQLAAGRFPKEEPAPKRPRSQPAADLPDGPWNRMTVLARLVMERSPTVCTDTARALNARLWACLDHPAERQRRCLKERSLPGEPHPVLYARTVLPKRGAERSTGAATPEFLDELVRRLRGESPVRQTTDASSPSPEDKLVALLRNARRINGAACLAGTVVGQAIGFDDAAAVRRAVDRLAREFHPTVSVQHPKVFLKLRCDGADVLYATVLPRDPIADALARWLVGHGPLPGYPARSDALPADVVDLPELRDIGADELAADLARAREWMSPDHGITRGHDFRFHSSLCVCVCVSPWPRAADRSVGWHGGPVPCAPPRDGVSSRVCQWHRRSAVRAR